MRAIAACRTAAPGGHRAVCTTCGAERITYNSCRNRHCPKCQRLATERWLAARRRELLPIEYFHVVFTLPHTLNPLAQSHPRLIYRLLCQAAASTLMRFGRDPRHLGGELGVTAVLHTWGQNLSQHVHVHCVVTGGALASDGTRWRSARPGFPRRGISTFASLADPLEVASGLEQLRSDIAAGRIEEVIRKYVHTGGDYLFVVARKRGV